MIPFAIAGLQLNLSGFGNNLKYINSHFEHLLELFPWVEMVVFSELAVCGALPSKAETLPGPTEQAFQQMAAKHKVWLINGSMFELKDHKIYNTTSVIQPNGEIFGRYRKLFPFRPYEVKVEAGNEFLVFDVPDVGRFGISICYDMWFPETSRSLAALGAEVIIHPSMTTTIDRDVELAIARATAATNQCFVIDINGVGGAGNGHSLFVGPDGEILYQAGTAEELIPLEIDLERVRRSREVGLRGLGQPLKSFRDCQIDFPIYKKTSTSYLNELGPLVKPSRPLRSDIAHHGKKKKH